MTPEEHILSIFRPEIEERDIMLTNKKAFGDDKEHEYHFVCYDGIAYGTAEGWHDPAKNKVILSYPTIGQLSQYPAKQNAIRKYCGLPNDEKITYGDIAMKYGKMGKWFIPAEVLNVLDALSIGVSWLRVSTEGNFYDVDEQSDISPRTAMHDLLPVLEEDNFNDLPDHDKFIFVKWLGSLI